MQAFAVENIPVSSRTTALDNYEDELNKFLGGFFADQIGKSAEALEANVDDLVEDWIDFARQSKIISGTSVLAFDPYEYQIELCRVHLSHPGVCAAKIRQCGITETFSNIFLWKASKNPAYTAVVFSQSGDATSKVAERVKRMATTNPYCEVDKANTREVSLVGGGRILFRTSNPGASRGLSSVHDILFDEWAFIAPAGMDKTLWSDVTPAQEVVGKAAKIAVVSTPPERTGTQYMDILKNHNGKRDIFKITRDMREGLIDPIQWWVDESGWAKFFIHWRAHPIFSQRDDHLGQVRESKKLTKSKLEREFNLNFEAKDELSLVNVGAIPRYQFPEAIPAHPWLIFQSWDTAQSDGPGSAKWAGGNYLLYGGKIYLTGVVVKKMRFMDGCRAVKRFALDHNPHIILIENKSSGADIIDFFDDDPDFRIPMKKIEPPKGVKSKSDDPKVRRFSREVHQIEAGKFILPEWAPWLTEVEQALSGFPAKEYRDFGDQLSQALAYFREESQEDQFDFEDEDGGLSGFADSPGSSRQANYFY